jgi:hypothetical protein
MIPHALSTDKGKTKKVYEKIFTGVFHNFTQLIHK